MKWGRIGVVAAAVAALSWGARTWAGDRGPSVTVQAGEIRHAVVARGVVVPEGGAARVLAPSEGRVARVLVQPGDRVRAGEALAALAPRAGGEEQTVSSPIDGVVIARAVSPGDSVTAWSAGTPMFEVADTEHLELRLEIEERDAAEVTAGAAARTGDLQTRIARLSPRIERRDNPLDDAASRAASRVRLAWAPVPAGARVLVGQRVEVTIEAAPRHVDALVPRGAVAIRDGRAVVRVRGGLFARETAVRLGACDGEAVEILGVGAGTEVLLGP